MRRNPPAKWTLPTVVNPSGRKCFIISVPDEPYHIAAFRGALLDLASAYKWADDTAHTAKDVALVWRDIIDAVTSTLCDTGAQSAIGEGADTELMIRQNPTNPCQLQTSIDGVNWCTFADFSKCIGQITQPGSGGTPTPPGQNSTTCYTLQANNRLLLNFPVYGGDTLEVTSASGAGSDSILGALSPWKCPDGSAFNFGVCGNPGITSSSDPLNTVAHMRLIWQVNGTYYDAMAGPITVPSGGPYQALLQVNDATISDDMGSYDVCIKYTNNQTATFTHIFDFTLSGNGFAPVPGGGITPGAWTAGTGWTPTAVGPATDTYYYNQADVSRAFSSRTFTYLELHYDYHGGTIVLPSVNRVVKVLLGSTAEINLVNTGLLDGNNQVANWSGSVSASLIEMVLNACRDSSPCTTGSGALKKLIVQGNGTDPF